MRKAFPQKNKPLPTGVKNISGKVITNPNEKKKGIFEHFAHRMRKRPVREEVEDIVKINENLFEERLANAKTKKSPAFAMEELDKVLKTLKSEKSKGPEGYICELFQVGVIGTDLKLSIMMMMNQMKNQIKIPESLRMANVTILHKKGCKLDLGNWRGIFVSSVLRTILMKMKGHMKK